MAGEPTVAVPVLPVVEITRAVAFYERLGFVVRAAYDGYAIVAFDGAEVHLNELPQLAGTESPAGAYLRVADVDAVHARWTAMGAREVAPVADQPYGIREFATEDLDGNLWRIGAPVRGGPLDGWEPDDAPAEAPADGSGRAAAAVDGPGAVAGPGPDAMPAEASTDGEAGGSDRTDGGPGTGEAHWFPLVADGGRCAGCGLAPGELHERALGAEVRDIVHAFGEELVAADDDAVRRRPAPGSWSALEYGVHVRDLLVVFAERIIRTLAEHEPELGWWDHEAAIEDGMANESDVSAVADDLGRNASKLSEALRLVDEDDWSRGATRRGSERFTIELMARFTLHEVVHHRADARVALAAVADRRG